MFAPTGPSFVNLNKYKLPALHWASVILDEILNKIKRTLT